MGITMFVNRRRQRVLEYDSQGVYVWQQKMMHVRWRIFEKNVFPLHFGDKLQYQNL